MFKLLKRYFIYHFFSSFLPSPCHVLPLNTLPFPFSLPPLLCAPVCSNGLSYLVKLKSSASMAHFDTEYQRLEASYSDSPPGEENLLMHVPEGAKCTTCILQITNTYKC